MASRLPILFRVLEEKRQASPAAPEPAVPPRLPRRALVGVLAGAAVLLLAFAAAAFALSGAGVSSDSSALARVDVQAFGGTVERVRATGPNGKPIPVSFNDGRLLPKRRLAPGTPVTVEAVVKRPGWIGWLAGSEHRERLTLRTPEAHLEARWLTVGRGGTPRVSFDQPVRQVAFGQPGGLSHRSFAEPRSSVALGSGQAAGSVVVAAAPRSWEKLGSFQSVTWFPAGRAPALATTPAPGADASPSTPLRLTFSKPVSEVLGSARPALTPQVPGSWQQADSHTLVFHPSGYGAGFNTKLKAELPKPVELIQADGSTGRASEVEWTVPPGSTLRLQQLLAEAGYLPVDWKPAGAPVAATPEAQVRAATEPPRGRFSWRYPNTPASLREAWSPGRDNVVTQGALMSFEDEHEMEADGVAGPEAWQRLMEDAIAGRRKPVPGYSYVYVNETLPETVTLWHNGRQVLSGAANTGIPGAETEQGTFPVFEHLEETTMSGENPDGSHYEDPGIKWVSYFNGGDALHAFDRASFGSPQSLGCVEMPLEEAAEVFPYTPIGTLVTVAG
jgi:L,D-transpeptidase catalytic domain